jgi:hypothetical protein
VYTPSDEEGGYRCHLHPHWGRRNLYPADQ